jgi:capsular exopolysaccharide synthesis family protein
MHHPDDTPLGQERFGRDPAYVDGDSIDFQRLANLLRAKIWIIIAVTCVVFLGAVLYVLRAPRIYESRAILQVSQEPQKVLKIQDISEEKPDATDYLNTVVNAFGSRNLMLRVIRSMGLENDPKFAPPKRNGSPYSEIELANLMSRKVAVSLRRNSRVIDVSAFDENPERAQQLASTFVQEFLKETFEQRREAARVAHEFLRDEAANLKGRLEQAERKLQAYKESNNTVSLEERQNIIVEQLQELNTAVTEAKGTRLRLEADLDQIRRIKRSDSEALLQIESIGRVPQVALIRERLLKAENDLAAIAKRNLPMHPRFITAQTRIADLKATLADALSRAASMLTKEYESAREAEAKLQRALKEQEQKAMELNRIAIPYNVLQRDIESDRALFESVTLRLKETYITGGIDDAPFRTIEEPLVPAFPTKPRAKLILALALVLGSIMGVGTVIGLDVIDGSLRTVDEAESYLELPALASIPDRQNSGQGMAKLFAPASSSSRNGNSAKPGKEEDDRHSLIFVDAPRSREAEAFRTLRATISLLGKESEFRSFLFTSAIPSEGKTFTSLNFASSLAQVGHNTVVIDADLREPELTQILLSQEPDAPGLTDLLSGQIELPMAIRPTQQLNLSVLPAGRRAPDAARLLSNREFGNIVGRLLEQFDRVVIDSPPVNAVSDVLLIAASAHATCLVVRAGKTPKKAIRRAVYQLHAAHASLVGFVFNRLPVQGRSAGYYYYYYGERYAETGTRRQTQTRSSAPNPHPLNAT